MAIRYALSSSAAGRVRSLRFSRVCPAHDVVFIPSVSQISPSSSLRPAITITSDAATRPRVPTRCFHTSSHFDSRSSNATERQTPRRARDISNPERGPESKEDTQTDFSNLDVLQSTPLPSTSVDVCTFDGFVLDSGLRIKDGNGIILVGTEAFVWRPWMTKLGAEATRGLVDGNKLRTMKPTNSSGIPTKTYTGGVINAKGQFEIPAEAWSVLAAVWPRPDILIVGTGPSIRPLEPKTRVALQELGMRIEVLDTRNAASHFNLMATERGVAEVGAALVPIGFGDN